MKKLVSILWAFALALAVPVHAQSTPATLVENFDDISHLTGWVLLNQSVPPGENWFQGNPGVFVAQAGAPGAYIAANFAGAGAPNGMVDLWLITPPIHVDQMTGISFWTRTADGEGFSDMLEVRYSPTGSTDPASFTTPVQPAFRVPTQWLEYAPGVHAGSPEDGRFAFHYTGPASELNYIGIDSLRILPVPEPSAWAMLLLGLVVVLGRARALAAAGALVLSSAAFAGAPEPGAVVVRDPLTGQLRAPTAQEFQALRALEATLAPRPAAAPTVRRADGTVHKHLGESAMSYAVISRGADGKLAISCVEGGRTAEDSTQKPEEHHEDR
ncbi:MAG TPA: choice-of-anchor J domain-containing protein [Telluria sp.]|nr:choice-of-anchor J domain-containing protein [Telluria sp.]